MATQPNTEKSWPTHNLKHGKLAIDLNFAKPSICHTSDRTIVHCQVQELINRYYWMSLSWLYRSRSQSNFGVGKSHFRGRRWRPCSHLWKQSHLMLSFAPGDQRYRQRYCRHADICQPSDMLYLKQKSSLRNGKLNCNATLCQHSCTLQLWH